MGIKELDEILKGGLPIPRPLHGQRRYGGTGGELPSGPRGGLRPVPRRPTQTTVTGKEKEMRKVGVMVESFRLGVRGGIEKAAELGLDGVQIYVTRGDGPREHVPLRKEGIPQVRGGPWSRRKRPVRGLRKGLHGPGAQQGACT